jgi:hypothetical protein
MLLCVGMLSDFRRERKRLFAGLPAGAAVILLLLAGAAQGHCSQEAAGAASPGPSPSDKPEVITLDEAIRRAEANEPNFASAKAGSRVAGLDKSIALGSMLPSVVYHNQALYTEPNGLQNQAGQGAGAQASPKFIANNAVREYASQATINETLGLQGWAGVRRADAASVMAVA